MMTIPMKGAPAPVQTTAHALIQDAIARHGATKVLLAAAIALLRKGVARRDRPPDVAHLPRRMRADIGLRTEPDMPDRWDLIR